MHNPPSVPAPRLDSGFRRNDGKKRRNDDGDRLREKCGVFGVYAPWTDVARVTFYGIYAL